jgi:branched-chain amino acid transport system permease protein
MLQRLRERITPTDVVMWLIGGAILALILIGSTATLTKGPYAARHWFDFVIFGLAQGSIYVSYCHGLHHGLWNPCMINFAHSESL